MSNRRECKSMPSRRHMGASVLVEVQRGKRLRFVRRKAHWGHSKKPSFVLATIEGGLTAEGSLIEGGAGDEIRTRDPLLGRQMLCQLSYSRSPAG